MNYTNYLLKYSPKLHNILRVLKHKVGSPNELHRLLSRILLQKKGWTFLQAGANDGVLDDPYREFILRQDAPGILVEPWNPFFHDLRYNYRHASHRLTFLNAAVTYPSGKLTFYSIDTEKATKLGLDASIAGMETGLDRRPLELLLQKQGIVDDIIISRDVLGLRIEEMIEISGYHKVDVLFLDLEGYEKVVLREYDDDRLKPKVISFESKHLEDKEDIFKSLQRRGFKLFHAAKDTVAVRDW